MLKRYAYVYDTAGNRTTEQIDQTVTGASFTALNRLLGHQAAGTLQVAGQLDEAGSVTVDGQAATVDVAHRFVATKAIAAGSNAFTVVATDANGNARSQTYDVDSAASRGRLPTTPTAT